MSYRALSPTELVDRAAGGDQRAVGRLLTLVERGGETAVEVAEATTGRSLAGQIVGITGAPGSGKSTLVGRMLVELTDRGRRPAVLAVDPSSPISGGAILGDRIRMDERLPDGCFVRSMATRGHQGGLALAVPGAVRVLSSAGFDPVIVETVGVGQVEVDIVAAADTAVVVATPGMGDAVQANKAGLLEVADVFVVNKADRPGATDVRRDLELMLDLSHVTGRDHDADGSPFRPDVLMVSALEGDGIAKVVDALDSHMDHLRQTGGLAHRRRRRNRAEIETRAITELSRRVRNALSSQIGLDLIEATTDGALPPTLASEQLLAGLTIAEP